MKKKLGVISLFCCLQSVIFVSSCGTKYKYPNITIACMGDSITYGWGPDGERLKTPYPETLQKELSVGKCFNYGIGGSTITDGYNSHDPMVNRIKTMDKTADIVIFWGGVNDYICGCDLGSKGQTSSSNIYGALENICRYLTSTYANKFIMFITPLPTTIQSALYTLNEVRSAIQYTCSKYNIPVLDLYLTSGFEEEMYESYSDGLHPTQNFVSNSIVPKISEFIKTKIEG